MAESQLDVAVAALVRELLLKFQPPEFIPGCVVQDVTNISDYTTNNGWIEALCGRHNQQRVRYKGFPINVAVDDVIDVVYYPSHKFFEVHGAGGATVTSADWVKISDLWESDFGAIAWSVNATGDLSAAGAYDLTTTGDLSVANITASAYITLPNATAIIGSGSSEPDLGASASANRWGSIFMASGEQINSLGTLDLSSGAIGSDVLMIELANAAQDTLDLGDVAGTGDVDIDFSNGQMFLEGSTGYLGLGTTSPGTISAGSSTGITLNIYDGTNAAELALQGTSGGAKLNMIDLGGSSGQKWMQYFFDGDYCKYRSLNDDASGVVANNILVLQASTGYVGIGNFPSSAQLLVDQASATGSIPVLKLDQGDVDVPIIEFVTTIGTGNAIEAVGAKTLTPTHFLMVKIPGGLTRYIELGTIA